MKISLILEIFLFDRISMVMRIFEFNIIIVNIKATNRILNNKKYKEKILLASLILNQAMKKVTLIFYRSFSILLEM